MEVLIFTGFGGYSEISEELINILKKNSFPKNRTGEIVDYIKNNSEEIKEEQLEKMLSDDFKKYILKIPSKICKYKDKYYTLNGNYVVSMKIIDVDISKKWKINEYDGSESIKYLELECVDKDMNYYNF